MNWFILALTATGLFVFYNLLSRVLAIKSTSPRAFTVIFNAIAASLALLLLFIEPGSKPVPPIHIILLTALGFFIWGVFARMEFLSRKHVEASTLTVLVRLAPLVTLFSSAIILHESLTPTKLIAVGFIFLANIILAYKNTGIPLRHIGYAVILSIALGLGWTFDKMVSGYYALSLYTVMSFGFPSALNAVSPPLSWKDIKKEWHNSTWKIVILGAINVSGYYLYLLALRTGEISKVSVMISSAGIITMVLGIWLLNERGMLYRKICAGVCIAVSLFLLR